MYKKVIRKALSILILCRNAFILKYFRSEDQYYSVNVHQPINLPIVKRFYDIIKYFLKF